MEMKFATSGRLRDSIGVCTHLNWRDTVWGQEKWIEQWNALGVKHTRTSIGKGGVGTAAIGSLRKMLDTEACVVVDPTTSSGYDLTTAKAIIDLCKSLGGERINMLEGPNEPDNPKTAPKDWDVRLAGYLEWMRATMDADDFWLTRDLGAPTPHGRNVSRWTNVSPVMQRTVTAAGMHWYMGARMPTIAGVPSLDENGDASSTYTLREALSQHQLLSGTRRTIITEWGYGTSGIDLPASAWFPPPDVAAIYQLRGILELFNAGVVRSHLYSLIDDKRTPVRYHGLLDQNLAPKPGFLALQNFVKLLDPVDTFYGDAPSAELNAIGLDKVKTLCVWNDSDDSHTLFMWQDEPIWDVKTSTRVIVPPKRVILDFGMPTNVALHEPNFSDSPKLTRTCSSIVVPVGGHVIGVRFR